MFCLLSSTRSRATLSVQHDPLRYYAQICRRSVVFDSFGFCRFARTDERADRVKRPLDCALLHRMVVRIAARTLLACTGSRLRW